jgi:predicted RNase H-like nuclease (RuvC/YqgF family)
MKTIVKASLSTLLLTALFIPPPAAAEDIDIYSLAAEFLLTEGIEIDAVLLLEEQEKEENEKEKKERQRKITCKVIRKKLKERKKELKATNCKDQKNKRLCKDLKKTIKNLQGTLDILAPPKKT